MTPFFFLNYFCHNCQSHLITLLQNKPVSLKCFYSSEEELQQITVLFLALTLNWKNHMIGYFLGSGGVFVVVLWWVFLISLKLLKFRTVTLSLNKLKLSYYPFLLPAPPLAAVPSQTAIYPCLEILHGEIITSFVHVF